MTKTVLIVQARVGPTRLPGKTLKILGDRTVLAGVIGRVQAAKKRHEPKLAQVNSHVQQKALRAS